MSNEMLVKPEEPQSLSKMNSEIKAKWLTALRSGNYKQGRGALHKYDGGFCCWGVLCDLYMQEKGLEWEFVPWPTAKSEGWVAGDNRQETAYPPNFVAHWAGLECSKFERVDSVVCLGEEAFHLSELNDGINGRHDPAGRNIAPMSFEEIAKLIEEQL